MPKMTDNELKIDGKENARGITFGVCEKESAVKNYGRNGFVKYQQ